MTYDVKQNIFICIFVFKRRLSFALEVRRRVLCFTKYDNNLEVLPSFAVQKGLLFPICVISEQQIPTLHAQVKDEFEQRFCRDEYKRNLQVKLQNLKLVKVTLVNSFTTEARNTIRAIYWIQDPNIIYFLIKPHCPRLIHQEFALIDISFVLIRLFELLIRPKKKGTHQVEYEPVLVSKEITSNIFDVNTENEFKTVRDILKSYL